MICFMKKENVVGINIRRIRIEAGLTQEKFALNCGLSQGYINQLESGKRRFTQKSLEFIAETLAIPIAELFLPPKPSRFPSTQDNVNTYKTKLPSKKSFMALLDELPDHIVEHYFILLTIERNVWKKKLPPKTPRKTTK